ncbi:hypothetical protein DL95DRAFT_462771 [Leptodontidium sp. 2 PMI_412]|nr:hypothetical protein DL95DRAFT_462771 [Leptodontidium sp. 2 PMI_412]
MSTNSSSAGALHLTIGSSVFTTSLLDNPTASEFQSLLPLNLQMSELNGNEKHAELPTSLPTSASNPGSIRVGDLMLYGSRTLVLWYEDYSSSFTYTRIGRIDDPEGLVAAVGAVLLQLGSLLEAVLWPARPLRHHHDRRLRLAEQAGSV